VLSFPCIAFGFLLSHALDQYKLEGEVRRVSTTAHEFGASVDYQENATFLLQCLTPQT
jgi:hypothetical protein